MANKPDKGTIIAYDLKSLPHGVSVQQIIDTVNEHKIVFYDGKLGPAPLLVWLGPVEPEDVKIVDMCEEPQLFFRLITNT